MDCVHRRVVSLRGLRVRAAELGYRDRLARCRGLAEKTAFLVDREVFASAGIADPDGFDEVKAALCRVVAIDQDRVGVRDLERPCCNRWQHGVEIKR